jgi:hypothetical protein
LGDQARPFVGAGRAAIGVGRHGNDDYTAVAHCLELMAQQQGLRPGLPGMWHVLGGRLAVSRQCIPAEVDAGGQHQPVIGKLGGIAERDCPCLRIDRFCSREIQRDALAGQLVVAELLRL